MEIKNENTCHDCGKELSINNEEIQGGVYLVYDNSGEKINILKCDNCYAKNPALTNYQPCEVYSRVVGYIRPVQQWHKGKKQEYGEREEFKMPSGESCC
ncbi:MAG: anaerobic ribonucleoside-triphosphate reductase [Candidatus Staskawiczbacteria bacterium]|jgi:transcription elongation factor Elf1